jgi:hypothetical protein
MLPVIAGFMPVMPGPGGGIRVLPVIPGLGIMPVMPGPGAGIRGGGEVGICGPAGGYAGGAALVGGGRRGPGAGEYGRGVAGDIGAAGGWGGPGGMPPPGATCLAGGGGCGTRRVPPAGVPRETGESLP